MTTITSTFTAYYVHLWSLYFPDIALTAPLPSFDGRAVQYPSIQNLRDYMSWRQVDCRSKIRIEWKATFSSMLFTNFIGHINNLYNTTFWALIQKGGMDAKEAEKALAVCHRSRDHLHILANYLRAPWQLTRMRFFSQSSGSITIMSQIFTRKEALSSEM